MLLGSHLTFFVCRLRKSYVSGEKYFRNFKPIVFDAEFPMYKKSLVKALIMQVLSFSPGGNTNISQIDKNKHLSRILKTIISDTSINFSVINLHAPSTINDKLLASHKV